MSRSLGIVAATIALVEKQPPDDVLQRIASTGPHDIVPALWSEIKQVVSSLGGDWRSVATERSLAVPSVPKPIIAILDDEADRIGAMQPLLAARFSECQVVVFQNSPDMVLWLKENLHHVRLLSLDHDLGPNQLRGGTSFDPGTGRDVADFLTTRPPQCPVILHTTNSLAAPGMQRVLEEAGWAVSQVVPYGDLDWVGERWIKEVRRMLRALP
jgi:hypothetical protein